MSKDGLEVDLWTLEVSNVFVAHNSPFWNELFNVASTTPIESAPGSPFGASELDFIILRNLKSRRTGGRTGGQVGEWTDGRAGGRADGQAAERAGEEAGGIQMRICVVCFMGFQILRVLKSRKFSSNL